MKPPSGLSALVRNRSGAVRMVAFLASGALIGKILGFARELLMARVFGASLIADSFRGAGTAVMMPLIPMQNEGVPAVMIPMHRAWQEQGRAPQHLAALCAGLSAVALLIALAIEAGGSWWVALIVGRMEPEGQSIALTFVRVMAVWMPASVLLNCLSAAEIATGRSRIAALRPTALNTSVMTGIVLYAVTGTLIYLPVLFALSFNVLGAWGVWTLWREGALDPKGLRIGLIVSVLLEFLHRLRPLMLQPLAEQGQVWLERIVASGFAVGTLASIDYARTLTDSAVLLIAQPIGMAVLYRGISENPRAAALSMAGPLLAVTVPGSVFLAVFAPDIVTLIFARGAFDETAVTLTSGALRGIAMGLWATTLGMILLRFLNNAGRNGRAALILAAAYAANAGLNLVAWRVIGPLGNGSILIGSGEAVRGLVLLAGTALALGAFLPVMRLISVSGALAASMAALCIVIQQAWTGLWAHLAIGGLACLATILLGSLLLMPGQIAAWRGSLAGVRE
jgi:putative peptidoglycan lipid II flippase